MFATLRAARAEAVATAAATGSGRDNNTKATTTAAAAASLRSADAIFDFLCRTEPRISAAAAAAEEEEDSAPSSNTNGSRNMNSGASSQAEAATAARTAAAVANEQAKCVIRLSLLDASNNHDNHNKKTKDGSEGHAAPLPSLHRALLVSRLLAATCVGRVAVASAIASDPTGGALLKQAQQQQQQGIPVADGRNKNNINESSNSDGTAPVVDMDCLRALCPGLRPFFPPRACMDALAATAATATERRQAEEEESSGSDDETNSDNEDYDDDVGVRGGGWKAVKHRSSRRRSPAKSVGGLKRARTCLDATAHENGGGGLSPCPGSASTTTAAADNNGFGGGGILGRHRSTSRSPPPPPVLRNNNKNSFAFKVRAGTNNTDTTEGANDLRGRSRSPLPPRSTASYGLNTSNVSNGSYGAGGGVGVGGYSPPPSVDVDTCYHGSRDESLPTAPSPLYNTHQQQQQPLQQQQPNPAALKQTTLNFGANSNNPLLNMAGNTNNIYAATAANPSGSGGGHGYGKPFGGYGIGGGSGGSGDVNDRTRKRYAPGGHNDAVYNSSGYMNPGDDVQNRRSYFNAPAPNLSPPSANNSSSSGAVPPQGFVTAGEQLVSDVKAGRAPAINSSLLSNRSPALGLRRGGFQSPFQQQQPQQQQQDSDEALPKGSLSISRVLKHVASQQGGDKKSSSGGGGEGGKKVTSGNSNGDDNNDEHSADQYPASLLNADGSVPEILKPLDPKLVTQVAMEILEKGAGQRQVGWDDIAGLENAKSSVDEAIIWPLKRPDLFVGLRDPPRGLLLFGPPGTGKTMIARAIANRASCTFMNISSSSLMSKWLGDGEKLVRCMFAVATVKQPSVIFIDEIDSLLSMRGEGEMDSVRRVKTEFLVQLDGVATDQGDRVLLIGATNRPDELDEAARRRMEKRLYIPLPDAGARRVLVERLLNSLDPAKAAAAANANASTNGNDEHHLDGSSMNNNTVVAVGDGGKPTSAHTLRPADLAAVVLATEGYSGADLKLLCREAAMGPLREMTAKELSKVESADLRAIDRRDFKQALRRIKPSVGVGEVTRYTEWNDQYGSFADNDADDIDDDDDDDAGGDLLS